MRRMRAFVWAAAAFLTLNTGLACASQLSQRFKARWQDIEENKEDAYMAHWTPTDLTSDWVGGGWEMGGELAWSDSFLGVGFMGGRLFDTRDFYNFEDEPDFYMVSLDPKEEEGSFSNQYGRRWGLPRSWLGAPSSGAALATGGPTETEIDAGGDSSGESSASSEFLSAVDPEEWLDGSDGSFLAGAVPPIPEPSTLFLLGTGMISLMGMRKRRK